MATTTEKKRTPKYLNRDFSSFKKDIVEHLRIYFPDTIQDFNESSVGMMLTEMLAFMGDNMSFYLDKKFNETFIDTAKELKNLMKHAKQLGFKPSGKSSAVGVIDAFIKVPATTNYLQQITPNLSYAGTIKRGAKLQGKNGQTYETLEDIDFSTIDLGSSQHIAVSDRDSENQQPTSYVLRFRDAPVKAGETKSTTFSVVGYKAFNKVTITEEDVLEVLSVVDAEGNRWYEVDFLAQDTVFDGVANASADSAEVPYVLKLRSVPYRFITEYDISTNKTSLIFGSGDSQSFDGDLIPNLGDLALPLYGKDTFTDFSIDPQNFLKTRTLGLAPVNTTLTVKYRVGGGTETNTGASEIISVSESVFDVGDTSLNAALVRDVANSFSVNNPRPLSGGKNAPVADELRHLIPASFAAQSRIVTIEDYIVRSLSMPAKFGSVFRANARNGLLNKNSIELYVLSRNAAGNVITAPLDLKENLKRYLSRFRMVTDAIEILDTNIVNVGVNFGVLVEAQHNKVEVLANCIIELQDYFDVEKWQVGQPINISSVRCLLSLVSGVLSVYDLRIFNKVGNVSDNSGLRSYSSVSYNTEKNTENDIIYAKDNIFFEVKYKNKDIVGVAR